MLTNTPTISEQDRFLESISSSREDTLKRVNKNTDKGLRVSVCEFVATLSYTCLHSNTVQTETDILWFIA